MPPSGFEPATAALPDRLNIITVMEYEVIVEYLSIFVENLCDFDELELELTIPCSS